MSIITIILYYFLIIVINIQFISSFDRITKYKRDIHDSGILFYWFIFFGPILFLFYKKIKRYRKISDIKKDVLDHELLWGDLESPFGNNEYLQKKRWLKLKKLQKKIKK